MTKVTSLSNVHASRGHTLQPPWLCGCSRVGGAPLDPIHPLGRAGTAELEQLNQVPKSTPPGTAIRGMGWHVHAEPKASLALATEPFGAVVGLALGVVWGMGNEITGGPPRMRLSGSECNRWQPFRFRLSTRDTTASGFRITQGTHV